MKSNADVLNLYFNENGLNLKALDNMDIELTLSPSIPNWVPKVVSDNKYEYIPALDIYDDVVKTRPIVISFNDGTVVVSLKDSDYVGTIAIEREDVRTIYNSKVDQGLLAFVGYNKLAIDDGDIVLVSEKSATNDAFDDLSELNVIEYIEDNRDDTLFDMKKGVDEFAESLRGVIGIRGLEVDVVTFEGSLLGFYFNDKGEEKYFMALAKTVDNVRFDLGIKVSNESNDSPSVNSSVMLDTEDIKNSVINALKTEYSKFSQSN